MALAIEVLIQASKSFATASTQPDMVDSWCYSGNLFVVLRWFAMVVEWWALRGFIYGKVSSSRMSWAQFLSVETWRWCFHISQSAELRNCFNLHCRCSNTKMTTILLHFTQQLFINTLNVTSRVVEGFSCWLFNQKWANIHSLPNFANNILQNVNKYSQKTTKRRSANARLIINIFVVDRIIGLLATTEWRINNRMRIETR